MRRYAFLLLALAALVQPAAAQIPDVDRGDRVRLLAIGGYRATGTAARVTLDGITVQTQAADSVTLPYVALRQLEVLRVTTSTFKATRRGLAIGTAMGLVATAAAAIGGGGSISVKSSIPIIGVGAAAGTLFGAIFLRKNAWEVVTLPAHRDH